MKVTQKSAQNNSGTRGKQNKSSKRSKGNKNSKDSDPIKPQEKPAKPKSKSADKNRKGKKTNDADTSSDHETVEDNGMKAKQAEKRKQDGNEWKTLKRIDYQRLETVVEEGQLSSEETALKPNCSEDLSNANSEDDLGPISHIKSKKPRIYNLVPIVEQQEMKKPEEVQDEISTKTMPIDDKDSCGEPAEPECKSPQPRRNVNLNGMMEILPIFSNDKFVCSRDAISIEEYEELEPLEKKLSQSANSVKKEAPVIQEIEEKVVEKLTEPKDLSERKLRYKMLTDINLTQRSSSHFINSLLVLTPFATDRDTLSDLSSITESIEKEDYTDQVPEIPEFLSCELKTLPAMIFTTLGFFSICLALAWKSYEPPCLIDYILEFIPFIHRRRTFVQLFFDQLLKILSNVFGG